MTNPPSHRCENYFEPDQLRGDLDSKNNVSKYRATDPFCKLANNCSQFPRKCSFFLLNDIYECLSVTSEDEFFLQKIWASKTQW